MSVTLPFIFYFCALILLFLVFIAFHSPKHKEDRFPNSFTLVQIDEMDGHDFEYCCAELLKYDGFSHISVTKGSYDQGVDILAYKDNIKYAIQCKRYKGKIGNKAVQEVNTGKAIYNCARAIVLTNNYFTDSAREAARATDVLLWDRRKLVKLIYAKEDALSQPESHERQVEKTPHTSSASAVLVPVLVILVFIYGLYRLSSSDIIDIHSLPRISAPAVSVKPVQTSPAQKQSPTVSSPRAFEPNTSVRFDNCTITVNYSMFARHNGNLKYMDMASDGLINCAVYADITNLSDQAQMIKDMSAYLLCDGVQYTQLVLDDSEFLFSHSEILPSESLNNRVIDFQIPEEYEFSDTELVVMIVYNNTYAAWKLR